MTATPCGKCGFFGLPYRCFYKKGMFIPSEWVWNNQDCEDYQECSEIFWMDEVRHPHASHDQCDKRNGYVESILPERKASEIGFRSPKQVSFCGLVGNTQTAFGGGVGDLMVEGICGYAGWGVVQCFCWGMGSISNFIDTILPNNPQPDLIPECPTNPLLQPTTNHLPTPYQIDMIFWLSHLFNSFTGQAYPFRTNKRGWSL